MTPGTAEVGTGTDAAIIAASRSQPERFAELFDRHAGRIHRYVARRLGRDTAGDLVAETFLAGIPVGTVRSRLNRARSQVRAALGGTDPTDAFDPPHEERSRWTT